MGIMGRGHFRSQCRDIKRKNIHGRAGCCNRPVYIARESAPETTDTSSRSMHGEPPTSGSTRPRAAEGDPSKLLRIRTRRTTTLGLISFRIGPRASLPFGHLWSHIATLGLMINQFIRRERLFKAMNRGRGLRVVI